MNQERVLIGKYIGIYYLVLLGHQEHLVHQAHQEALVIQEHLVHRDQVEQVVVLEHRVVQVALEQAVQVAVLEHLDLLEKDIMEHHQQILI